MNDSTNAISTSIRHALSQPTVRVGQRLLSERQLATRLHVPHAQVRKSLLHLVDEGLLIQKRGSGTFVRRIPAQSAAPSQGIAVPSLSAAQILHQSASQTSIESRAAAATHYDLGLWWNNLDTMTPLQQLILAAMVEQVESMGHRLSFHSLGQPRSAEPADLPKLRERVQKHRNDAYLCIGWCDGEFRKYLQDELHVPIVFFDTVWRADIASPHVAMNGMAAQELAACKLLQSGCKNICEIQLHTLIRPMPARQGQYISHYGPRRWLKLDTLDTAAVVSQVCQWIQQPDNQAVDGLYVTDDHLLPGVAAGLAQAGKHVGRDIAVISMSNKDLKLRWPEGSWSTLEFDPVLLGRSAVELLVQGLTGHAAELPSLALNPRWKPGTSHLLDR